MNQTFGGWTVTDFIRRIRELEAELLLKNESVSTLRLEVDAWMAHLIVAELERIIRENADASRLASEASPSRHSRRTEARSPGAQSQPREREAE